MGGHAVTSRRVFYESFFFFFFVPQNTGLVIWRFGWHVQEVRVAIGIVEVTPALRRFKAHDTTLRHALVRTSVVGRLLRECDFWNRVEGCALRAGTIDSERL